MRKIDESKGFFKMYWDLFDPCGDLNWQEAVFLSYLIEVWGKLKETKIVNGVVYKRLANSYIQERMEMAQATIWKYLNKLSDLEYIKIYNENEDGNKKVRYYTLNIEIVREPVSNPVQEPVQEPVQNLNIKETKETNNTKETKENTSNSHVDIEDVISQDNDSNGLLKEEKDIDIYKAAPTAANDSSMDLRDIFSLINSYKISESVKRELQNFFKTRVGHFSVFQVKERIDKLISDVNYSDVSAINAIKKALDNNWGYFYIKKVYSNSTTVEAQKKRITVF